MNGIHNEQRNPIGSATDSQLIIADYIDCLFKEPEIDCLFKESEVDCLFKESKTDGL